MLTGKAHPFLTGILEATITARNWWRAIPYRGRGRWCPVCEKSFRRFGPFGPRGSARRAEAQCRYCGALERHRWVWLYFYRQTNLFDGTPKRILHVAPETCFEFKLRRRLGQGYLTADLNNRRAMTRMDIAQIQYPDSYFDGIYCSHVLEHVPDDRRALREFYRVLQPTGWAILLVPITTAQTVDGPPGLEPAERLRRFGQKDHVRRYGADFPEILRKAGFKVRVSRVADLIRPAVAERLGLTAASGEIYHCSK